LTKRTAKIGFVVVAAILLQFYWVRELVFAEAAFALVFVVVGLIAVVYAASWVAVLKLWKLGVGALVSVSVRQRQPFAKVTITGLSEAKEEVS
jgi:hypothetical protein